jgi:hypothetical protein
MDETMKVPPEDSRLRDFFKDRESEWTDMYANIYFKL